MKINHTITALLAAASLAVAAPAVAQSDPPKDRSQLKALEQLDKLSTLGDLRELRSLSRDLARMDRELQHLHGLGDLSRLDAELGSLRALRNLSGLAELGRLSSVGGLGAFDSHNGRLRIGPGGQVPRHAGGPQETEKFTKTFRVGASGSLDLTNISGDIVIKVGAGDEIVIDATKRTPQGAKAKAELQSVTISAEERAGRVQVKTIYPERMRENHTAVDFAVTVPAAAAITVHSISGDIQTSANKGALRLTTVSGNIRVDAGDQIEELKSISGDVTVTGGGGTDIHTSTVSGDLVVRNLKARALEASSISGEARLTDVAADRAGVKTISGGIEFSGPFAQRGRYDFQAHSGDVRITPSTGTGFEVNAESFSGGIRCDLPMTAKSGELSGRHLRRELKGTVGDGSASVTVTTFSGDVTIAKK